MATWMKPGTSTPTLASYSSRSFDDKDYPLGAIVDGNHERIDSLRRPSSSPSTKAQAMPQQLKQETAEDEGEDNIEYPKAWKLAIITLSLCLSIFCVALDNTIIATAIPRITDEFKALNDVGWYGSAYLLTTCAFQLFFGRLYTFFSIKVVYLCALAIFELGSLVCGVAPNSNALIIGRAVAGVGAAGVFSGAILIIAHTVPLKRRPAFMGFIGAMYGIASVAGPLMGGAFTDKATWRWCFYINLPLGAITIFFIFLYFKVPGTHVKSGLSGKQKLGQLDLPGTIVFIPAIVCLLLALQWGGSKYPWSSGRIIALFVVFGILIIAFIGIQLWQQEKATVPPRIIKQRHVWSAAWFAVCVGAAFFVMVYFLPIWFQAIEGVSAVQSGIRNLPLILGLVIISVIAGILVTILGYYTPFCLISTVLMSIGAGLLTTFEVTTGMPKWIGYQLLFGVGVGFGMQQSIIAVQAVLELKDVATGTAVMMFSQTLGGALFISVAQNVFTNKLIQNLVADVSGLDPNIVLITGATSLAARIPAQFLPRVLVAYNAALTQTFYVSVAMSVLSIFGSAFMGWKSVKGKNVGMGGA